MSKLSLKFIYLIPVLSFLNLPLAVALDAETLHAPPPTQDPYPLPDPLEFQQFLDDSQASSVTDSVDPLINVGDALPKQLQPQLSSDGKSLSFAVPVRVVVADEAASPKARIRPPSDIKSLQKSATATFQITYNAAGTQDPWGETCLAFPEAAKAAYVAASAVWGNILKSSVPIRIKTCWANLGSSSILGYSGGGSSYRNFSGAPQANTWYNESLANALHGSRLGTDTQDMYITYNTNFNWYFGVDGNTPTGQYDLMTVVLHEIAHGLNFSGSANYSGGTGSWGMSGYPEIYDRFMEDGSGNALLNTSLYPNPSTALGGLLTSTNLWFDGSNANAANGGTRVKMYSPRTWSGGSSYSHLDYTTFSGTINRLMVYAISSGTPTHDPGPVTKGLLKDLGWPEAALAPTQISPNGTIGTRTPAYVWNAVPGATYYYLAVYDTTGWKIYQYYSATQTGCTGGTTTCTLTPSTSIANGNATWWVAAWNGSSWSPWSPGMQFKVEIAPPAKPTLISPSGAGINTSLPDYTWNAVSGASYYYLAVQNAGVWRTLNWYSAAQAGCSSGASICKLNTGIPLSNGTSNWYVLAWNGEIGPWSDPMAFTVSLAAPSKPTLVSPSGTIQTNRPPFVWNQQSGIPYYYLAVLDTTGWKYLGWVSSTDVCPSGGTSNCSMTIPSPIANGIAAWAVQAWNRVSGPWSDPMVFTVNATTGAP